MEEKWETILDAVSDSQWDAVSAATTTDVRGLVIRSLNNDIEKILTAAIDNAIIASVEMNE